MWAGSGLAASRIMLPEAAVLETARKSILGIWASSGAGDEADLVTLIEAHRRNLRLPIGHLKDVSAELLECALTAGEDDNLLVFGLSVERVEHLLDPVVVRINECVVEDDWRRPAVRGKLPREGEPCQYR